MGNEGINGGEYRKIREWMKSNLPWVCHRCAEEISRAITIKNPRHPMAWSADHYPIPRAKGGLTILENLKPAHLRCNGLAGQQQRVGQEEAVANPRSRDWGI